MRIPSIKVKGAGAGKEVRDELRGDRLARRGLASLRFR